MPENILITGADGNLGKAVSAKMLQEGYRVAGTLEPGHIKPDNSVDFFECDLSSEQGTKTLFGNLKDRYKALDAAILLVGGFAMGNIESTSPEDINNMFRLNFMTAFNAAQSAYTWMKEHRKGKIILIGAKPAVEGGAAQVLSYAISKSAVIRLAGILNETGRKDGIQTSVIVPSVIDTPPNRAAMPNANFDDWVKPEAIADAIHFLIAESGDPLRDTVLKLYNRA